MKPNNFFAVIVFEPTECTSYTEIGFSTTKICKKINDTTYQNIEDDRIYTMNSIIGCNKIEKVIPLSDYYYNLGLRKRNNHNNKAEVHSLVKSLKKERKM